MGVMGIMGVVGIIRVMRVVGCDPHGQIWHELQARASGGKFLDFDKIYYKPYLILQLVASAASQMKL